MTDNKRNNRVKRCNIDDACPITKGNMISQDLPQFLIKKKSKIQKENCNFIGRKYDFSDFKLWETLYKKLGTFEGVVEELKGINVQQIPSAIWVKEGIEKLYLSKYGNGYKEIFSNFVKKYSKATRYFTIPDKRWIYGKIFDLLIEKHSIEEISNWKFIEEKIFKKLYINPTNNRYDRVIFYIYIIDLILRNTMAKAQIITYIKKKFNVDRTTVSNHFADIGIYLFKNKNYNILNFYYSDISDYELIFYKNNNIDYRKLISDRFYWMHINPSLIYTFYNEVILPLFNRIPSVEELKDFGFRGYTKNLYKIGIDITQIRKNIGLDAKLGGNRIPREPYSADIVYYLKKRFYQKPWNIKNYMKISDNENIEIEKILNEVLDYIKAKHSNDLKACDYRFFPNSESFLKRIIKIVPLILSSKFHYITTFTELNYLSDPISKYVSGDFIKFIKLFYSKKIPIPFQKRIHYSKIISGNIIRVKHLEILRKLDIHLKFPSLFKFFKNYFDKGIPPEVFKNADIQPRISHFKIKGLSQKERIVIEEKLKRHNLIIEVLPKYSQKYSQNKFLSYCCNLISYTSTKFYKKKDLSSRFAPYHQPLLDNIFFNDTNTLAVEFPIWYPIDRDLYLTGHPDLTQFFDNFLIVTEIINRSKNYSIHFHKYVFMDFFLNIYLILKILDV